MEERIQYEMKSREAVAAANVNLAPPFRTGSASFATSAAVASAIANRPVPNAAPPAQDAADVMTGATNAATANAANLTRTARRQAAAAAAKAAAKAAAGKAAAKADAGKTKGAPVVSIVGVSQEGGSSGSTGPVLGAGFAVQPVAVQSLPQVPKAGAKARAKGDRSPSSSRHRTT